MTVTLREVALRTPVSVLPETAICDAEQQLIAREASEIYVVNELEQLLGVVPDSEILNYRLLGGDGQGRIASLATPVPVSLNYSDSLEAGARILREHTHSSIPVLDSRRLIGQLCRSNLLRIFAMQGYAPETELFNVDSAYLPKPKFLNSMHALQGSPSVSR